MTSVVHVFAVVCVDFKGLDGDRTDGFLNSTAVVKTAGLGIRRPNVTDIYAIVKNEHIVNPDLS